MYSNGMNMQITNVKYKSVEYFRRGTCILNFVIGAHFLLISGEAKEQELEYVIT